MINKTPHINNENVPKITLTFVKVYLSFSSTLDLIIKPNSPSNKQIKPNIKVSIFMITYYSSLISCWSQINKPQSITYPPVSTNP